MAKVKDLAYRRIVVKFGTSLLTGGSDRLNEGVMSGLVAQVAQLHEQGAEVIVVSSGAITAGRNRLGISQKLRQFITLKHRKAIQNDLRMLPVSSR